MKQDDHPSGPLGAAVPNFTVPPRPPRAVMTGRYAQLEPLNAEAHAALLFRAFEGQDQLWHYMYDGPFSSSR